MIFEFVDHVFVSSKSLLKDEEFHFCHKLVLNEIEILKSEGIPLFVTQQMSKLAFAPILVQCLENPQIMSWDVTVVQEYE